MNDHRDAFEPHTLDVEQLDLLAEPVVECHVDESAGLAEDRRVYQLTELPGETFEDIFRGSDAA